MRTAVAAPDPDDNDEKREGSTVADITAALIRQVRELTGAGMSDVKKALVDAEGIVDKAVEALRLKGSASALKRGTRTASNGLVAAHLDGPVKVLLELNCETDFVAKSETFQSLATDLADHVATHEVADAAALLDEPFGDGTVKEALESANAALGEKIEVGRLARFTGANVSSYLHRTAKDLPPTIGVLVETDGAEPHFGKEVAQHVAAFPVSYLTREEVPAATVEAERSLAEQLAKQEGKPEAALTKIVEGRLTGFYKEVVLLDQAFVKDNKKTVAAAAKDAGVTVTRFAKIKVGSAS